MESAAGELTQLELVVRKDPDGRDWMTVRWARAGEPDGWVSQKVFAENGPDNVLSMVAEVLDRARTEPMRG